VRSFVPWLAMGSVFAAVIAACSSGGDATSAPPSASGDAGAAEPEAHPRTFLPPEPQRAGDPQKGYRSLVNEAYVPCGIPWSAYSKVFAEAPEDQRVPGREGRNIGLPYNFTAMTTKEGVEIVTSNCLTCHAGRFNDKLIVGLGAADGDFTRDAASQIQTTAAVGMFLTDEKEKAEWRKWKTRVDTVAPYSVLSTRGPNPADGFTAVLFAHHDPKTLAWSDTPLMKVPAPQDVPVDVPPWWRMKKKSSMFYVGGGRGDHARIMMTASILCTSSVEESKAIDAYFADVRAYIANLEPPKYPFALDRALAERGRPVFEATCSRCHGTYGPEGKYPNLLISTKELGTDPILALGAAQFAAPFVEWFKSSFFGEIARLEPQQGYVAPPLEGIWATAPYLHNGSVPTIEALLDSSLRPTYWTRSFDSKAYDERALGWKHKAVNHGKDAEKNPTNKAWLYDTTRAGYSKEGHTFGDVLSPEDRAAVLEYLKTL
jgi:processive rubber oxygenase RoxA-like protein